MNFKNVLSKYKKIILAGIISIFVGMGLGFLGAPTQERYNEYLLKNNQATEKLDVINANLANKKCDFDELTVKKTALEEEQNKLIESERLVKEAKEKKAQEEAEKLVKEAEAKKAQEEEADRLAKIEEEKNAQKESQKLEKVETEKRAQQEERKVSEQNNLAKARNNNVRSSNVDSNEKRNYSNVEEPNVDMVWQTKSGKKYHSTNHCGKTDFSKAVRISIQQAKSRGLRPCSKCY